MEKKKLQGTKGFRPLLCAVFLQGFIKFGLTIL